MKEEHKEDFQIWIEEQPGYISYTQCRTFLSSLLEVNKGKAEVEMAKMQRNDEIKIIQTYKTKSKGRRVFVMPLDDLHEADLRAVWDGSSRIEMGLEDLAKNVHDRTGHSLDDIYDFVKSLQDEGKATVYGDIFKWEDE